MKYVDPDGRRILGTNGKPVTFSNGTLSSNANFSTKQYVKYMTMMSKGRSQLNTILGMKEIVEINVGGNDPLKRGANGRVVPKGTMNYPAASGRGINSAQKRVN